MTAMATVQRTFIDRSRVDAYQRCPRRRWWEYHQDGIGIRPSRERIDLAVGGAVHEGLRVLLKLSMGIPLEQFSFELAEMKAVEAALQDLAQYTGLLEVDVTESAAMVVTKTEEQWKEEMVAQAKELGLPTDDLGINPAWAMSKFESMLYEEQAALTEGMVRAWARHKLRPLLEQFEVLEVEHEGEWRLSEWYAEESGKNELWFMSRLDALLRERHTDQLHLQSFKTTGTWGDIRRFKAAEHDIQGLTESIEVENRLQDWWVCMTTLQAPEFVGEVMQRHGPPSESMTKFLKHLPEAPRIYAVRYEYLLKGSRFEDKELSTKLGMTVRTQRSPLIRRYVAHSVPKKGEAGYAVGDVCWSWDFFRVEDDKDSKLSPATWHAEQVPNVKDWITALAESEIVMSGEDSTIGMEPRPLGWKNRVQRMGVTRGHPFDEVFPPPIVVVRSDDELRDMFEQIEAQEIRVAGDVEAVKAAKDLGEKRSLLNQKFPQHRSSCFYPTECWATRICYATNPELAVDPLGKGEGKFKLRVPNHPQELHEQVK